MDLHGVTFIPIEELKVPPLEEIKDKEERLQKRSKIFKQTYDNVAPELPKNYADDIDGDRRNCPEFQLYEMDLYVTMRCNIRCSFCSVRAGEYDHEDLSLARIKSLLDEARGLGLQEVHFLGGEPTLRSDLEEMISHAAGLGIETGIITNGMTLRRDRLASLMEAGLDEIMFSIDGLESTHNRLRKAGKEGWKLTIQAVNLAVSAGLETRVATAAYQDNYQEIVPLLRLFDRLGVTVYNIFLGSPLGRGHEYMMGRVIGPHEWRELQEEVGTIAGNMRSDFEVIMEQGFAWSDKPQLDRSQLKGRGTGCNTLLESFDYLIVRSDGNLYQCVFFMTEGSPIGNIVDHELFPVLHYAKEKAQYRDFTVPKDKCVTCFHQEECGTGCRGYAYLYKKDWLKTDPRCSKEDPNDSQPPAYYPVCPILKANIKSGRLGGNTWQALEHGSTATA